ncbi:hypothetical protein [Noviherbaspirillum aerium]|uniref:hypothetical protein n=1 Tax=Noviherbaspirillum aerium TaxID=2588497 RepID=UPI00124D87A7|nr:hypothetical protein [Noviherbaspirillum aerium]
MKNTASKIFLTIILCILVFTSDAAESLISVPIRLLDSKRLDQMHQKIQDSAPNKLKVNLFAKKSFSIQGSNVEIFSGEFLGDLISNKNECFVYVGANQRSGKIFNVEHKSDRLWHCAGEPKLSVQTSEGTKKVLLILVMYLFQAPSGDSFYLPQAIEITKDGDANTGNIDQCIDKETGGDAVRTMRELSNIAARCIVGKNK